MFGTGLLIDNKPNNEILFSTVVKADTNLPDRVSLRQYASPIRNQGTTGFCWAFAAAGLKAIQESIETGRTHELSPLYIASKGKAIDGRPNTEGSVTSVMYQVLSDNGTVAEKDYPFSDYKGGLNFPYKDLTKAYHYKTDKIITKLRTPQEIMQALAMNKPVTIGLIVAKNIYDLLNNRDKYISMPVGSMIIGGHKTVLTGYDKTLTHNGHTGFFDYMNSWGIGWGDQGYAWLPFDYITYKTADMGMSFFIDAETIVDLKNDPVTENVIIMNIDENKVRINGKEQIWEVAPVIKGSRTLVPLRRIAETLGYKVYWRDETKEIKLVNENHTVVMFLGSNVVCVDGKKQTWDIAPQLSEQADYTLVPLRYIAELLGFQTIWKQYNKEITLVKEI